jgi:hypothetical protein
VELDAHGRRRLAPLGLGVLVVIALAVLVGCTTLTPQQSAALKEAQRFADEVTDGYRVGRLRVIVGGSEAGYYGNADVISIGPPFLGRHDQRVVMAVILGAPTLKLRDTTPGNLLAANRQGVKIMIRFLGMTNRQAIDRLAALFVADNESHREGAGHEAGAALIACLTF